MNALGETLNTLTSQIKFVSANNPGGGEGTLVPQTGDIIGIILAIVAAVAIIAVGFIVASSKLRSSENISGGAIAKNKVIGIALSVVAVLSLAGILYCYMPSWIANAGNTQAVNEATGNTVYAYVDEVTGEITFDENFIKNETDFEVSLASSRAVMTDEVAGIEGIDKVVFGIEALDSVVYYDTLAKPGEQREAFQPTMHGTLMPGEQAAVKYSIENCDKILARALIGKTVVTTSVDEVNCFTVTYQVSSGESVEGEVPAKQVLVPGQSVTVANYDTLYKWGYSGKPNYWVGSDAKQYKVDQVLKYEDLTENLTLQTAIDGWVEDDPITIYYDTEVDGVFEATSDSETILPVSGNPEGCTVTLSSGFQLDYWYNTETGEEVGWETTFIPPRNEHGIYEEAVYSVQLSLVEEDTADEPQSDNASVTLKYVANTGGIVTLGSETLESETSTPKGSEAKAGKGFKFDHWNNAAGEEISRDTKLVPQPEGGVYKSTTYTAMFVYDPSPYPVDPLCYNVYFESGNTEQGTVSTSFVLTTASPYYTYSIDGNVITVASSNTSKTYTIHADGKNGYVFSSWSLVDAAGKVVKLANDAVPISSNLRFVANFVPEGDYYQITFEASEGGDPVSPSTMSIAAGTGYSINKDVITFEDEAGTVVTANKAWADYRFVKWEVSPTDTGSVDQALTFTAKYSKNTGEMCTLTLMC